MQAWEELRKKGNKKQEGEKERAERREDRLQPLQKWRHPLHIYDPARERGRGPAGGSARWRKT